MKWLKSAAQSESRSHSHSHSHSASRSPSDSSSKSETKTTPTSHSLLSLFIVFAISFVCLRATQPSYVMDASDPSKDPVLSYRLVLVYSLLWSSTVALAVFAYYYVFGTKKSTV